jgi:predicted AlkP superfamily phosphohydrolase/phosphomutase
LTRLDLHRVEVLVKKILGNRINILPRDERPEFIKAIDWTQTQAYSFGYYGQVFVNLKGREPEGIVDPGSAYESLRDEIAEQMLEIIEPADGRTVVDRVYKKEELYHGHFLNSAPDLLAIMRDLTYITRMGYEFAEQRGILFREPYTKESGSHRREGILIGSGPDIVDGQKLTDNDIQNLTPTLLHLQNCAIPNYMDGNVITELLSANFSDQHPIQTYEAEIEKREGMLDSWNEENEAEISDRLKKLGYLG